MRRERVLEHARSFATLRMTQKNEPLLMIQKSPFVILSESCCSEESRRTLWRPASATHSFPFGEMPLACGNPGSPSAGLRTALGFARDYTKSDHKKRDALF